MGSRFLPLGLVVAALAAETVGLGGLALWLGLFAVPAAAAAAFVSVSDLLEGKNALMHATTSSLALAFIILESAVRSNVAVGAAAPPLATWALVAALLVYSVPTVAWVLEPVKITRRRPEPRRRRVAVAVEDDDVFSRAA